MKKIISLVMSLVLLVGIMASVSVPASAASTVKMDQKYSFNFDYQNEDCKGYLQVPQTGLTSLNVLLPTNSYGSEYSVQFVVSKSGKKYIDKSIYDSGSIYMSLPAGTYSFSFHVDCNEYTELSTFYYRFKFKKNYNNNVRATKWNTTYSHYYTSKNCYSQFVLKKAGTVTFTLTQPLNGKKEAQYTKLHVYDMNKNGKEIATASHSSSESYKFYYKVRLPKGKYRFNYECSGFYEYPKYIISTNNLLKCTYKLSYKAATKPKAPTIKHSVKVTKSTYSKYYNIDIKISDSSTYDGMELWVKKGSKGKWELSSTGKNTEYSRYTKGYVYFSSSSYDIVYYKVRTYSLYGTKKYYSNFSKTLYTRAR